MGSVGFRSLGDRALHRAGRDRVRAHSDQRSAAGEPRRELDQSNARLAQPDTQEWLDVRQVQLLHVAYYKDSQGVVYLRGSAKSGNTSQPAFTLPADARPAHTLWLPVYAFDGAAGGLEIKHNGQASLFDAGGGATVRKYASLDGVSFRVP